jgi:exodeoxyribonuclease VII large subunit
VNFPLFPPDPPRTPAPARTERDVYSVSRLNKEVRLLLESGLPLLWLEGELSNFAAPASGHWYFSLKDSTAQVRCAMWRQRNTQVRFKPKDGMAVLVRARVGLYEPRGEYQLLVEHLEEAGEGALKREFEKLKARLAAEGLFALERKRPLPAVPRRIGVVSSPTGAAIHDILRVLRARFPAAAVLLYPTAVQGAAAVPEIVRAIEAASRRNECDVLIVARGGGSLEDLWCFNDERVARAIAACRIPTVSGVGHEVDVTIADFVADVRAPTPSAAALATVPDKRGWLDTLRQLEQRFAGAMGRALRAQRLVVGALAQRLQISHPGAKLVQHAQRLDDLEQRMRLALRASVGARQQRLEVLSTRLWRCARRRRHCGSGWYRRSAEASTRSSSDWRSPRARSMR